MYVWRIYVILSATCYYCDIYVQSPLEMVGVEESLTSSKCCFYVYVEMDR